MSRYSLFISLSKFSVPLLPFSFLGFCSSSVFEKFRNETCFFWGKSARIVNSIQTGVCWRTVLITRFHLQELNSFVWDKNSLQFLGPQQIAEREKLMAADKRQMPSPAVCPYCYTFRICFLIKETFADGFWQLVNARAQNCLQPQSCADEKQFLNSYYRSRHDSNVPRSL